MGTMFAIIDFCTVSRETRNSDSTAGGRFSSSFQDLCHCTRPSPSGPARRRSTDRVRGSGCESRALSAPPVALRLQTLPALQPGFSTIGFTDCIDEQWIQYRIISRCSADSRQTQARSEGATDNEPERAPGRGRHLGKPEFNRDLQAHTKFPGDHQAHSGFGDIGAAAGQIFGDTGPQRDQVEGYADGYARKRAAAPFPTPSMELHSSDCLRRIETLRTKSCHAAGIYDERGACESR